MRCRASRSTLPDHAWAARVAVTGGHGYLFADNADLAGWQSWLKSFAADDLAEYKDFGGGVYRAASFSGDRIETCLFIGPARDAGDWNVVKGLFAADTLGADQRRMLLSGKSMDGLANAGPIVCACFGVGRNTICDAIAAGARSAADIGAKLKAGTNCGSCIPELKRLIAQTGYIGCRATSAGGWTEPLSTSLRANGSRECAPDDRLREAIRHLRKWTNGLLRLRSQ